MTERDPELRKQLFKSVRLWTLSLICALMGSVTMWQTNSVSFGVLAFLASLVMLGPILWLHERRRRPQRAAPAESLIARLR